MCKFETKRGFTLVELIVVIAIIGLLATVGVSSYSNVLKSGRDTKRIQDANEIWKKLLIYKIQNGNTPSTSSYGECSSQCGCWDSSSADTDGDGKPFVDFLVDTGVLEKSPVDPQESTTAGCGNYDYYTYPAGEYSCDATRGTYMVLGIRDLESSGRPHKDSPGWACGTRDWKLEFDWVVGQYQY
ncbi:type II secretion system protein [Candidatus Woesebacteria bacterium]|nr:type II secretion system protein [Candidatus Woesebacteria bacterium]